VSDHATEHERRLETAETEELGPFFSGSAQVVMSKSRTSLSWISRALAQSPARQLSYRATKP